MENGTWVFLKIVVPFQGFSLASSKPIEELTQPPLLEPGRESDGSSEGDAGAVALRPA